MFLQSDAVAQPFSLCLCVCLGSLFTLICLDLPEYLISPFLAAVSLHENWVG